MQSPTCRTSLEICVSVRSFKNGIVLRECREAHFWLRLILATNLVPPERVHPLLQEADELVAIFTTTVRRARLAKPSSWHYSFSLSF